ncbi:hypothetical protein Ahy_A03g014295 [Arachis hypogaea]|uniref:Uncharacterized protein n=1 Tax=Arachis hypogaea TaxID=3818 RepID=A0A445DXF1_ARAHY|nr:hypothetical protein Ahy_A03g014295 [Arachis hypogaea]
MASAARLEAAIILDVEPATSLLSILNNKCNSSLSSGCYIGYINIDFHPWLRRRISGLLNHRLKSSDIAAYSMLPSLCSSWSKRAMERGAHQPKHDLIPQARPLFHQDLYSSVTALGVGPTTVSDDQSPSRSAFLVTASAVGSGAASGAGSGAGGNSYQDCEN